MAFILEWGLFFLAQLGIFSFFFGMSSSLEDVLKCCMQGT